MPASRPAPRPTLLALLSLLSLVALSGCLAPLDLLRPGPVAPEVAPLAFDHAPGRPVALLASGCGLCGPTPGGPDGEPQAFALFLFEDGRLALVEWNSHPPVEGVVPREGVTYDRGQLAALLRWVRPEAPQEGAWVVRVRTAQAQEADALPARLERLWAGDDGSTPCTDHGETHVLAPREGPERRQRTTCVEEGNPFHAYAATMWRLVRETERVGVAQGKPAPRAP